MYIGAVVYPVRRAMCGDTLPAAAGQCYSYIIAADQTDGQRDTRRASWGVCGRQRDGQTRVRVGTSPSSPRSSLSHHAAPLCGGDSRGPVSRCNMTRTASQYTPEMRRRVHWGGERAAKCLARHTAVHRYRYRVRV